MTLSARPEVRLDRPATCAYRRAMDLPPLAVTMGEPAGIGGEIVRATWRALRETGPAFFVLDRPERLGGVEIGTPEEVHDRFAEALPVLALSGRPKGQVGHLDPADGPLILESIDRAVSLAMAGRVAGVVTNPIHKANLYAAGFRHPGHTEYLAALGGVPRTVMLLAGPDLKVIPVTIHVPLREVPRLLTLDLILETARIAAAALARDFGIARPRLALAGLNPHAGESGTMGDEDERIVRPAVQKLREGGIDALGPLPADTMFHPAARRRYDVALCMYHDQALIPIKTLAFDEGVNVTLGLPFVRTSPDHGTALDIAGKGIADPSSLIAAIRLAADMASRRRTPR
ncbi:MAG: 4-hydroxythreonine-4-phosphate dehydrogenase PdxA [Geminicoccaceae bacterium]